MTPYGDKKLSRHCFADYKTCVYCDNMQNVRAKMKFSAHLEYNGNVLRDMWPVCLSESGAWPRPWDHWEPWQQWPTLLDVLWSSATHTTPGKQTLRWRHNGHDAVSNHQPHHCLLNHIVRRRSKKTSKLRVAGLCAGNSPLTGEFPAQMASNAENVSIWCRHHEVASWILVNTGSDNGLSPVRCQAIICINNYPLSIRHQGT